MGVLSFPTRNKYSYGLLLNVMENIRLNPITLHVMVIRWSLRWDLWGGVVSEVQAGGNAVKRPEPTGWITLYIPLSPGMHQDPREELRDAAREKVQQNPG